ncbi:MAG: BspA family leucine-rich repeat surface protein [Bacteroidota bacterium]
MLPSVERNNPTKTYNIVRVLFFLVLSVFFGSSALAQDVSWTGAGDGTSWEDPNNWSLGIVPGSTSNVVIDANLGESYTVVLSSETTVASLNLGISQATLELQGELTITENMSQTSGRLRGNSDLIINGELSWRGGRMEGNATTFLNGGAEIIGGAGSSGNNKTLDKRRLVIPDGQVFSFNGSLFAGQNEASIDIQEGALFDLITNGNNSVMSVGDGGAIINNYGTFSKSQGSTFQINIEWDFRNAGLLSVAQQDADLRLWESTLIDEGGRYIVEQGLLSFDLGPSETPYVFTPDSRLLAGPGARINLGNRSSDGSSISYELQGSVEMFGTFSVRGNNTATATIPATASLVSLGEEQLIVGASRGQLFVEITDSVSVGDLLVGSSGRLEMSSPLTVTGDYTQNNASAVIVSDFDITVQGELAWSGGRMEGAGTTFANSGAVITGGAGSSSNNKVLDQKRLVIPDGQVLSFNGSLFTGQNGAELEIQEGALFDLVTNSSSNVMRVGDGGATIINSGTISKSQGTTFQINIEWDLVNSGLLSLAQQDADLRLWESSLIDEGGQYIVELGLLSFDLGPSETPYVFTPDSRLLAGPGARINLGNRSNDGSSISYELQGSVEMFGTFSVRGSNTATATIPATASLVSLGEEQLIVGASRGQLFVETTEPVSIGDLTLGASGRLELSSPLTVTGDYTQNNASAVIVSDFDITVQGELAWSGGRMEGTGTTLLNGGATVTGGAGSSSNNKTLDQRRLVVPNGEVFTFNGSLFTGQNGAVIEVQEGGLFDLVTNGNNNVMRVGDGGATIINTGTFSKSQGSTFQINIEWDLENSGLVSVSQQDATLQWQGALTDNGGQYIVELGFLDMDLPASADPYVFTPDSRLLAGPGARINLGSNDGDGSETQYELLGSVEMDGIFSIKNFSGGTTASVTIPVTANLVNLGQELLLVGTSRGRLFVETTNPISVGDLTVGSIGRLELSSPLTVTGDYTQNNASSVIVSDFDITIQGELAWSGGRMEGSGRTIANGSAVMTGGGSSSTKTLSERTLVIPTGRDLVYSGSRTTGQNGAVLEIEENAIFRINSGSEFRLFEAGDGGATIKNFGAIQKVQGTTFQIDVQWALENSGLVTIFQDEADIRFREGIQNRGTIEINSNSAVLENDEPIVNEGTIRGIGVIRGDLENSTGIVQPGIDEENTGILTIQGNYTQSLEGILSVKIAGTEPGTEYDRLVTSSTALDGTIELLQLKDFSFAGNDEIKPLTWNEGNRTGEFSFVDDNAFSETLLAPTYSADGLILNSQTGTLPETVILSSPEEGATGVSVDPELAWETTGGADSYQVQIATDEVFTNLVAEAGEIVPTAYQVEGLEFETIYYWRVRGDNSEGPGEWSAVWSFTTEEEPLSPPAIVTLSSPEDGAVDVSVDPQLVWEPAFEATTYELELSLAEDFSTLVLSQDGISSTEFQLADLSFETPYFWRVRGVNEAGPGEWSAAWSFTTGENTFRPFITTWNTENVGQTGDTQILIPTGPTSLTYDYSVYWENVNDPSINGTENNIDGDVVLDFGVPGIYRVEITGVFPHIRFSGMRDFRKILTVDQWGDIEWTSMRFAFMGAENLTILASDAPNLSNVTFIEGIFRGATSLNSDLNNWDVSNVVDMSDAFLGATSFNGDITNWDVGSVENMESMFDGALAFNQDISGWDVRNVINMRNMFANTSAFNQDISAWETISVRTMNGMFNNATAFNQNLGSLHIRNLNPSIGGMSGMLRNTALSVENYDNTLIGFRDFVSVNDGPLGIEFTSEGLEYCNAATAREELITMFSWDIRFDSQSTDCTSGNLPQTVVLSSPEDEATDVPVNPQLSWDPAEGASTFELQLSFANDFSTIVFSQDGISLTEFQLADLSYETPYFWRVRGVNEAGQGEWSSTWNFTTEGEPLSPPDIVQLSSPEDGATEISINPELAWDPAVDAGTYQVQLSTEDGFTSLTVDQSSITETQLQVENLNYEVLYYWRVRAVNEAGVGEWSSTWSFTTKEEPLAPPEIVTLSSPVDGATDVSNSLAFAWESSEGAESYLLQVSTDKSFTTLVAEESELEATEFQVGGLEFERTYFWRVLGINQAGQGEWSTVWTFTTEFIEPETPVNFVLNQQNEFPRLTWETSSTTSGHRFNIYRGVSPRALEVIETVDASVLTFIDNQIPEGIYFYSVSSISSGGSESQKTTALSFVNDNLQAEGTWKLTSVPVAGPVVEAGLTALYSYEEKYLRETGLTPLTGYWMKTRSFDTEEIFVNGLGLLSAEFNLEQGWNLIGSLSDSIHVDMILDPENILTETPIYIYESDSYVSTDYIVPNQGHWIFAEEAGTINTSIRNSFMLASEPNDIEVQSYTLSHQIEVQNDSDARLMIENGQSSTHLHIQYAPVEKSLLSAYYLPPLSPDPVLDVRVENNTSLLQSDMEKVFVETSDFPLKLTIESDINEVAAYRMHAYSNNEKSYSVDLIPGQVQRAVEEFDYFTLEQIAEDEIVRADQLISSYPNPFNPSTTIQFELAQTTQVKLEVFDVVGRRVSLLAAEQFQAGQHFVTFRADNLSSGIYFVRFQTPQTVNLWKITLMK